MPNGCHFTQKLSDQSVNGGPEPWCAISQRAFFSIWKTCRASQVKNCDRSMFVNADALGFPGFKLKTLSDLKSLVMPAQCNLQFSKCHKSKMKICPNCLPCGD